MNLLEEMKKNNTIINTKGSEYYMTTYDSNLDIFTMLSRYNSDEDLIRLFNNALNENEELPQQIYYIFQILEMEKVKEEFLKLFSNIYVLIIQHQH